MKIRALHNEMGRKSFFGKKEDHGRPVTPIYINRRLVAEMAVESASPTAVLTDHFLGLRSLVLVMGGLGVLIVLLGLSFLLFHHPLSLTHRPTRAA